MKNFAYAAIVASVLAVPGVSSAQKTADSLNGAAARPQHTASAAHPTTHSFAVFVDRPTGFTFVKLPGGWKFVGAVTQEDTEHLPPGVLTSVLPNER